MQVRHLAFSLLVCLCVQQTATVEAAVFHDVQNSDWFAPYVAQLSEAKIISTTNANFSPYHSLSRAELAKMAVKGAQYQHVIPTADNGSTQIFCDVAENNEFYSYIQILAEQAIVNGSTANCNKGKNFLPYKDVSRAEALKILLGVYGIRPSNGSSHFTDVNTEQWYNPYIARAVEIGLVNGYSDGSFHPNNSLSRAEMSKILSRLMQFQNTQTAPTSTPTTSSTSQSITTVPPATNQQELTYNIGSPSVHDYWVSTSGNDSNPGTQTSPFASIAQALSIIPENTTLSSGYRIHVLSGTYGPETMPNYPENLFGTFQAPIILQGEGDVRINGNLNIYNVKYFYLINLKFSYNHDVLHFEKADHVLIRGVTLRTENRAAQETLKVNQSQYIYIEDSDISGANDNSIDFVAVQYGHTVRTKIHDSEDWCMYTKGGSAYYKVEGNEFFDCGTGGFTAGQGTGFEFMTPPWIHYEAYDIRVVNNIFHNIEGAGLGVNGGYNILMAHNTLYKVGTRDHVIEVVFGSHGCDGNSSECQSRINQGGWGSAAQEDFFIGNKHVMIYNNIIYNPAPLRSEYSQFAIYAPRAVPSNGSPAPNPAITDSDLQIKGNVIWNGPADMDLGIGGEQGCRDSNPTCNTAQILRDNQINTIEPQFVDPARGNFRLAPSSNVWNTRTFALPQLSWNDAPTRPTVPQGNTTNIAFTKYRDGSSAAHLHAGAY